MSNREAEEMSSGLALGEDIQALVHLAAARRLTMLFSATWSQETTPLASVLRPLAVHITVAGVPPTIVQEVKLVPKAGRGRRLNRFDRFARRDLLLFSHAKRMDHLAQIPAGNWFADAETLWFMIGTAISAEQDVH